MSLLVKLWTLPHLYVKVGDKTQTNQEETRMRNMFQSAVALSLLSALCFGIVGPMIKTCLNRDASPGIILFCYGLSVIVFSFGVYGYKILPVDNFSLMMACAVTGILLALAVLLSFMALDLKTGHVALVLILVASYPLLSSFISIVFMNEARNFNIPRLLFFSVVVIVGVYGVSTSTKAQPVEPIANPATTQTVAQQH